MFGFGRKKPPPIRSLICEGTVVQGQLHFVEGLRIDGEVIGDVVCEGDGRSLLVISGEWPRAWEGEGRACDHQRRSARPGACP